MERISTLGEPLEEICVVGFLREHTEGESDGINWKSNCDSLILKEYDIVE